MSPWRIAGINFDHMHMGDLLRMAFDCPHAEIVGIADEDPARMESARRNFGLADNQVFTDFAQCIESTSPDLVILCPATAEHAEWTEKVAPFGTHILVEKPFAASTQDADRMIAAVESTGKQLIINWPLRWYASHVKTKQLIDEGRIGEITEIHYYDGNRGPLYHREDKIEREPSPEEKNRSWWYRQDKGGGSLLDYLGYGVTLGTWYMGGRKPIDVMASTWAHPGLEVDEHSLTAVRYSFGMSKFETRWGTFTDPWTHQPQPKCGFVIKGTDGTISSYDYEESVLVQTPQKPEGERIKAESLAPPFDNPINYVLDKLAKGEPVDGPLAPTLARIGQQIVDTAHASSIEGRRLALID